MQGNGQEKKTPIEQIMTTTMENIKEMIDVNTVVGDPVIAGDGTIIIPISRVCFGFVAGGGEYGVTQTKQVRQSPGEEKMPFAGGTGAGVSVQPVGFLVVSGEQVRLLPTCYTMPIERLMEQLPGIIMELKNTMKHKKPTPSSPVAPMSPSTPVATQSADAVPQPSQMPPDVEL